MAIRCIAFLLFITLAVPSLCHDDSQTFIIHVSKSQKPTAFATHHHWYTSTLASLLLSSPSTSAATLLYTYNHILDGFSARLTGAQATSLRSLPGILSVVPERVGHLHTTHSFNFLGLPQVSGIWPEIDFADDVIIGVLDTGVWPEHRSFSDDSLPPVPARWKGSCMTSNDFHASSCNKKLIGAKFFSAGYEAKYGPINQTGESKSPRDTEGHGTHTASTAAGAPVKNASFYGYALGEAKGMASKARLAAYKICWKEGCFESDILAGMDRAVEDGVDVISFSVGISNGLDYDEDPFAIAAFGAVEKGVIVVCSAGNSGPTKSTLENIAPWILTVGASSIDRDFPADVVLGDGRVYRGVSLYSADPLEARPSSLPLVYAGNNGHRLCVPGVLSDNVKGKIVFCDGGGNNNLQKGSAVKLAGGVGMILASNVASGPGGPADPHVLPATMVDPTVGNKIRDYIKSDPSANATIVFVGTIIGPKPSAPQVAAFSSRGPNDVTPEIIKPDVIAPGVNILAGWTGATSPSELVTDSRRVEFNILYGTSMACPHVSGIAALLRKAHPTWSPAAIKSALMTTAYNVDNVGRKIIDFATGEESTPFDRGSGHVDPNRALDPGLVYDLDANDYVGFLCIIGYDESRITKIAKDQSVDCSKMGLKSPYDLNYPSFSIVFKSKSDQIGLRRVVKNVGQAVNVVYNVKVFVPPSVKIIVSPNQLVFSQQNQSLCYDVKFSSLADRAVDTLPKFGWIEWSDGAHVVRSPIAFTWDDDDFTSLMYSI